MEIRKANLILALEAEKERLGKLGHNIIDHTTTINYLKTGGRLEKYDEDEYPLLDAAINDYETLLRDYDA